MSFLKSLFSLLFTGFTVDRRILKEKILILLYRLKDFLLYFLEDFLPFFFKFVVFDCLEIFVEACKVYLLVLFYFFKAFFILFPAFLKKILKGLLKEFLKRFIPFLKSFLKQFFPVSKDLLKLLFILFKDLFIFLFSLLIHLSIVLFILFKDLFTVLFIILRELFIKLPPILKSLVIILFIILQDLVIILYPILKDLFTQLFWIIFNYLKNYFKEFYTISKYYFKEFYEEHATAFFYLVLIAFFSGLYILSLVLGPFYILKYLDNTFFYHYFYKEEGLPSYFIWAEVFTLLFDTELTRPVVLKLSTWPLIGFFSYKIREYIKDNYYYPEVDLLLQIREEKQKFYSIPDIYRPIIYTIYTIFLWHNLFFRPFF